jgi:serine protease
VIKPAQKKDMAANINTTYTVDLTSEPLNGAWKLEVVDSMRTRTGTLNSWSLQF